MSTTLKSPPLIVTLKMDEESQSIFDELRKIYYPARCNYVNAHITLFHKLPSNNKEVDHIIKTFSERPSFNLNGNEIVLLKNGIAYGINSDELRLLHINMQEKLQQYLIRNDRKIIWPHITIQQKVTQYKAFKTYNYLQSTFEVTYPKAIGFSCWHYVKGYWDFRNEYLFDKE